MGALYKATSGLIQVEKNSQPDEDNRTVAGYYTNDKIDLYGHIIEKEAMIKALPEYREWGTVREMHEYPCGTTTEIGHPEWNYLTTRVARTDRGDQVLANVREKVYKAFSVGIIVTDGHFVHVDELEEDDFNQISDDMANMLKEWEYIFKITGLTLVENSIVDRPANPAARIKALVNDMSLDIEGELPGIDSIRGIEAIKSVLPRDKFFVSNGSHTHVINAMGLSVPAGMEEDNNKASDKEETSVEENDMDKGTIVNSANEVSGEDTELETTEVETEVENESQAEESVEVEAEIEDVEATAETEVEETADVEETEVDVEEKDAPLDIVIESFDKMIAGQEATNESLKSLGDKIDNLIESLTTTEVDADVEEEADADVVEAEEADEEEAVEDIDKGIDLDALAEKVAEKLAPTIAERKGTVNAEGVGDGDDGDTAPTLKEIDKETLRKRLAATAVIRSKR